MWLSSPFRVVFDVVISPRPLPAPENRHHSQYGNKNFLDQMRDMLLRAQPFTFRPAVQFSPINTAVLTQALQSGRYREKAQADKKNFHLVSAFTLALARQELWKKMPKDSVPHRVAPSAWAT